MDRLDILRTFIAVAEQQSFAKAARLLRISPAAATRAVMALEAELGLSVLRRTTRSVRLTDQGAAYLERCRHALTELEDAAHALRGQSAAPAGTLVISAPLVFGRMHVTPILTRLLRAHPALNVELTLTDRLVRLVDEGVDVAVRIADLPDSALHALRIGAVRRVLAASPAYLAARGRPKSLKALSGHDLIAFDNFAPNGEWRFAGPGRPSLRVAPRLLTNSVDAAIEAALAGFGVVRALSYQVADHVAAGRLKLLLSDLSPPAIPVSLLYQANRQRSPNVRAFLDAAQAYFRRRDLG